MLQNEVKEHEFFSSINWYDLEQKRLPPPFNPSVVRFNNIIILLKFLTFILKYIKTVNSQMFSCRNPSMTSQTLIPSLQRKPCQTRCASLQGSQSSMLVSWKLMMPSWDFLTRRHQKILSCKGGAAYGDPQRAALKVCERSLWWKGSICWAWCPDRRVDPFVS